MDHNEALQCQACEKYLLGELSPAERDAFEEHYFSCAECAIQLRSAADFLGASREILAASPFGNQIRCRFRAAPRLSWLHAARFRRAGLRLLLAVIGYQNFVTIPAINRPPPRVSCPMHSLITANTLGDQSLSFTVPAEEPFGLYVDAPYDPAYSTISSPCCRLPAQRLRSALSMLPKPRKTQIIAINPGRQAGKYAIIVSGLPSSTADSLSAKELARLQFTVEVRH
jgi:hypothetical protein